jgi:formylglycine-generating enzyme required for sulfatase activity
MSTNSSSKRESSVVEIFRAIGAIVAVPTALFGLANSIFSQPIIALVVAMITAVLASIVVVRCGWTGITEVITAWLVLTVIVVIVLASFVIWPKTMTVEGIILDEEGNPISNEQVTLFDRSNRRYETKTDTEGYYQFIEVPSGKYRVQVRTSEIEGETKGILVRVVQQNLTVPLILGQVSPTVILTPTNLVSSIDTPTLEPPTNTPTTEPTDTPTSMLPTDTPTPSAPPGMVYIPANEFIMGSDKGKSDELPIHTVYLDAFFIDKTEVTNAQYRKCVEAGVCDVPSDTTYYDDANYGQHPVVYVSWNDADAYCLWAGKRLPTEAEWEKAARGTDGRVFSWGNSLAEGNQANFCDARCAQDWRYAEVDDGYEQTAPVGNYPAGASPYGALDMVGNVWEWVADWYDANYYSKSPSRNPLGPDSGEQRMIRGGSWYGDPHYERCTVRLGIYPNDRINDVGFRCAKDSQ